MKTPVQAPLRVAGLDHWVLTVADIETSAAFYARVLGMEVVRFTPVGGGEPRTALAFARQKINLHQAGAEFEPKATRPSPGSADLCLLVEGELAAWQAHLATQGVAVIEGPVARSGAQGPLRSLYIRDPDGNLIELSTPLD